ncbi:MAG: FkbM family methyltransferase [Candidatus Bipolaricaulota bacterium]
MSSLISSLRKVVHKADTLHRRWLGCPPRLVETELAGRRLRVREGTVRPSPDYDDAWLFCAAVGAQTIFDIGCNIGQSAMIELVAGPPGLLVLVDANREALTIAVENCCRNGFESDFRAACAFVSDVPGQDVRLYTVHLGAAGSRYKGHAKTATRRGAFLEVNTTTLDLLAERFGAPDLIKVDVEGAEAEVLAGATRLVRTAGPRFLVEVHSPPELPMVENARRILGWCKVNGYGAFYLSGHEPLTEPSNLAHRGRCHLLLQPAGSDWPKWARDVAQGADLDQARKYRETQMMPFTT